MSSDVDYSPEMPTFSATFDAALAERQMSLGALRRALVAHGTPISLASLSYWRSGARHPRNARSMRAIAKIEEILALAPGELESLIASIDPAADPIEHLPRHRAAVRALFDDLDLLPSSDEVLEREVTLRCDLGRDEQVVVTTTVVIEALVDGLHRYSCMVLSHDADTVRYQVETLGGCRLGRVLSDPASGVTVAELLLERELARGEIAVLDHRLVTTRAVWGDDLRYWAQRPVRSLQLLARFAPQQLPVRVETFAYARGVETVDDASYYGASLLHTAGDFGPGVIGIRWHWG